uniref:Uncharacterized protein n=1 Tax=Tetranychus urticae TaxID=32264 RepID=T1JRJ4_TETUR
MFRSMVNKAVIKTLDSNILVLSAVV